MKAKSSPRWGSIASLAAGTVFAYFSYLLIKELFVAPKIGVIVLAALFLPELVFGAVVFIFVGIGCLITGEGPF